MNDNSVVGQLKAEILQLEEAVNQIDQRKKELKAEIRTRKRALKLLNGSRDTRVDERMSFVQWALPPIFNGKLKNY